MNQGNDPSTLSEQARALVAAARRGVLATILPGDGRPYVSIVNVLPLASGDLVMFLSKLAEHRRYLEADPRASLLLSGGWEMENILSHPRLTLVGEARLVNNKASYAEDYIKLHPTAGQFIHFQDFNFFRFYVEKVRFIAGFGRMGWLTGTMYSDNRDET